MPKDKGLRILFIFVIATGIILPCIFIFGIYPQFGKLLVANTENEATRLATHLGYQFAGKEELDLQEVWGFIGKEADQIQSDFNLVKMKIFMTSGETVYSSDPKDVGILNQKDYFHEIVATGKNFTKVVKKEGKSAEGQSYKADVVETYVPVMQDGHFLGAFELYYDITDRLKKLNRIILYASVLPGIIFLFFIALIVFGLFRLDKQIIALKNMESILQEEMVELQKLTDELEHSNMELKNTQAQMLQREKMASIGQLAAGVAHEINNPMGFITSNLGSLKKYVDKFINFINSQTDILIAQGAEEQIKEERKKQKIDFVIEDTTDLLEESLDGAKRVSEIVQNLKGFSRLDAAQITKADINDCLETTLKIIWNELKYNATVHKNYGELPATFCNAQEMNQVFMNILVNAAHALEKQGDITIETSENDDLIKIAITDTGSGIEQDKIDRIFEPFFTTKPVGKGTGLGLSICYDIVKKHGGEITVESEIGKGTTFTIILPVKESAPETEEA